MRAHDRSIGRDLIDEALAGVLARPARLAITALGTVIGVAALVATLALAQTTAGQIASRFDAATATHVVVTPRVVGDDGAERPVTELPWDAPERTATLASVQAAGTFTRVDTNGDQVSAVPIVDPLWPTTHQMPVVATSPQLLEAVRGRVGVGRNFDAGHDHRGDAVALIGKRAAERLHIERVDTQPVVFVGERPFSVIGIVDQVARRTELLDAVIVSNGTAARVFGVAAPSELHIATELGAASVVGRQAPIVIAPNDPDSLSVHAPPPPGSLRRSVAADVNALFAVLGGVALLVGGLGIANVTLLSVVERVGEIGLRRALGARPIHIATQFLLESVATGLLGGLVGTAIGVVATVGASIAQGWTPVLDPRLAAGAPLLGALVGLLAGAYPASRAAATEPITALRSGA